MEQKTEPNNPVYSKGENQPLLLVLNEDPVLRLFLKYYFEKQNGMIIKELNSPMEALEYFYKEYPHCVIVNGSYISKMGLEVFESFSHLCQENYIPILITLDNDNLTLRKECITLADEVMVCSKKLDDLVIRVIYHLKKRSRIMDQILIDPRTGVKNEKFLAKEVERQIKDMKRSYEQFSLVYVQLDELTAVRKTYGYAFGHQIVKELGGFIQNSIRPSDSIFGYQNEGFVIVLPKTVKVDAGKLMNRLIKQFAELRFQTSEGEISFTFSVKVVDFVDPSQSVEQCISLMSFPKNQATEDRKAIVVDGTTTDVDSFTLRKLKIGIIDDDRLIRELLKSQLKDIEVPDYEVEIKAFSDGEEFFNDPWHRQNERFLLIIDRIMPKMDGLEVLERIRTQYDRRRYLCLMLTSKDSEADITLAIQRGANDYMIKPFSMQELRARIKRQIRGLL